MFPLWNMWENLLTESPFKKLLQKKTVQGCSLGIAPKMDRDCELCYQSLEFISSSHVVANGRGLTRGLLNDSKARDTSIE